MSSYPAERKGFIRSILDSVTPPFLFIALLWLLKAMEWAGLADLRWLGVYPRTRDGLIGILTAPLVHGNFGHLFANTMPLFVLSSGILFFYRRWAMLVFLLITIGSGGFVWVFGKEAYHIGASGLVYGCASFLVVAGFLNRNRAQIAISLLVFLFYGSMIWGILPSEPGISWEAHLGGLLAGIGCAFLFRQPQMPDKEDENDIPEQPRIGEYFHFPNEDER